ncbi:hypothetical protein CBFG_02468 [Clostridiales bacterium 1_7_47FAA]|nr:hypothetical protein CBFG_02468 [Clostridiales bacterium 1_7_47FAA]
MACFDVSRHAKRVAADAAALKLSLGIPAVKAGFT